MFVTWCLKWTHGKASWSCVHERVQYTEQTEFQRWFKARLCWKSSVEASAAEVCREYQLKTEFGLTGRSISDQGCANGAEIDPQRIQELERLAGKLS